MKKYICSFLTLLCLNAYGQSSFDFTYALDFFQQKKIKYKGNLEESIDRKGSALGGRDAFGSRFNLGVGWNELVYISVGHGIYEQNYKTDINNFDHYNLSETTIELSLRVFSYIFISGGVGNYTFEIKERNSDTDINENGKLNFTEIGIGGFGNSFVDPGIQLYYRKSKPNSDILLENSEVGLKFVGKF